MIYAVLCGNNREFKHYVEDKLYEVKPDKKTVRITPSSLRIGDDIWFHYHSFGVIRGRDQKIELLYYGTYYLLSDWEELRDGLKCHQAGVR